MNCKAGLYLYLLLLSGLSYSNNNNNNSNRRQVSVDRGTVVGKQVDEVAAPHQTKLVDIKAPDLSLNLGNNLSRSITLSTSQNVANARIDSSESNFKNKDRSAVVRAVVSVSDSSGNLVRKGTVTDITNE